MNHLSRGILNALIFMIAYLVINVSIDTVFSAGYTVQGMWNGLILAFIVRTYIKEAGNDR